MQNSMSFLHAIRDTDLFLKECALIYFFFLFLFFVDYFILRSVLSAILMMMLHYNYIVFQLKASKITILFILVCYGIIAGVRRIPQNE